MLYRYTAVLLLALSACLPKIKKFDDYTKVPLPETSFMPSPEELNPKALPKIMVFGFEDGGNFTSKQAGLPLAMALNVENIIVANRLGDLVDRKAAEQLHQEMSLLEMNQTNSYQGPKVTDYIISGTITNANFTSKALTLPNGGVGFQYQAEVKGMLKIYELSGLNVLASFNFSGSSVYFDSNGSSYGTDYELVKKAAQNAIKNLQVDIQNFFAKKGYIMEKRMLKNKSIFKINLGSDDGIKHGDNVNIFSKYEVSNDLTNTSEIETRLIASGVIGDKLNGHSSWVIVEDKKQAQNIRLGDQIKMGYKRSLF